MARPSALRILSQRQLMGGSVPSGSRTRARITTCKSERVRLIQTFSSRTFNRELIRQPAAQNALPRFCQFEPGAGVVAGWATRRL